MCMCFVLFRCVGLTSNTLFDCLLSQLVDALKIHLASQKSLHLNNSLVSFMCQINDALLQRLSESDVE